MKLVVVMRMGKLGGQGGATAYIYPEFPALLQADSKGRPWPQQRTLKHKQSRMQTRLQAVFDIQEATNSPFPRAHVLFTRHSSHEQTAGHS